MQISMQISIADLMGRLHKNLQQILQQNTAASLKSPFKPLPKSPYQKLLPIVMLSLLNFFFFQIFHFKFSLYSFMQIFMQISIADF